MKATASETDQVRRWIQHHLRDAAPPFSFRYGGEPSTGFLDGWDTDRSSEQLDDGRTRTTLNYVDPESGLEVQCESIEYHDFPAVEWVLRCKNGGDADTPIIADIQALDVTRPLDKEETCWIHHAKGSDCKVDDFEPLLTELKPSSDITLAAHLGRSSNHTLPFFSVETGDAGVVGAVGWTGGWAATFQRGEDALQLRAGMQETHLKLLPDEEIRSPRILLLFWEGDRLRGNNLLRQFILAHHTPRPDGELLQAPVSAAFWGENTEQWHIDKARWIKANDLPVDLYWIDAGWYGDAPRKDDLDVFNSEWPIHVGNWWPNKAYYPRGLQPVGEAVKELGMGFLLWIEPERVFKETYFTREHPEWLFGQVGDNYLFNLGIPEARQALTNLVSDIITEARITCYRQDFNTDPAPFWKAADAPDRVGMSEIRHIEGLYAFWDELLDRHPGLFIDNCSSGGRRIDLEMISRSIALWRSDLQCFPGFDLAGMQGQTYGLSFWVPLSTGAAHDPEPYTFRSAAGPGVVVNDIAFERDLDEQTLIAKLRQLTSEQVKLREYFYGDYYPLTSYSLSHEVWMAWQFDLPDAGQGMFQVFRRKDSPYESCRLKLHGLDADATYVLTDMDSDESRQFTGAALMQDGILVELPEAPTASVFIYQRSAS